MTKITAPKSTSDRSMQSSESRDAKTRAVFLGALLSMSWQLAIVVLVPVVGGFKLDQHLKTAPILTLIGFLVAMIGVYAVLKRVLKEYAAVEVKKDKEVTDD